MVQSESSQDTRVFGAELQVGILDEILDFVRRRFTVAQRGAAHRERDNVVVAADKLPPGRSITAHTAVDQLRRRGIFIVVKRNGRDCNTGWCALPLKDHEVTSSRVTSFV